MSLSEEQKKHILANHKKLSPRQLSKELDVPRHEIEVFLDQIKKTPLSALYGESGWVDRTPKRWLLLVLFSLTFLTYSRSLSFDFVYDDRAHLLGSVLEGQQDEIRPELKDLSFSGIKRIFQSPLFIAKDKKETSHYRPMQNLSYMLNYKLSGPKPSSFHLWNILLQCTAACALFVCLCRLLATKQTAFWVTAFFAVHPVQIAAVSYIAGRAESLGLIFMIASFYFFVRSVEGEVGKSRAVIFCILTGLMFFCGLLSKELVMVTPPLLWVYVLTHRKKVPLVSWIVFLAAGAAYLAIRSAVFGGAGVGGGGVVDAAPAFERPALAARALGTYIRLIFAPYDLHLHYHFLRPKNFYTDEAVLFGFIVLSVLLGVAWYFRRDKIVLFGFAWFWIALAPLLNLFKELNAPMADHWLYVPIVGFFIAILSIVLSPSFVSWAGIHTKEKMLGVVLLVCAVTTFQSSRVWKDEIALYHNILKYSPMLGDINRGLAEAYVRKGMLNEAKEQFAKAVEHGGQSLNPITGFQVYD